MKGKSMKKNVALWKNCVRACAMAVLLASAVVSFPQHVHAELSYEVASDPSKYIVAGSAKSHKAFLPCYFIGAKSFGSSVSMTQSIINITEASVSLKNDSGLITDCNTDSNLLLDMASRDRLYNAKPGDTVEISLTAYCTQKSGSENTIGVNNAITEEVIIAPGMFIADSPKSRLQSDSYRKTAIMYRSDKLDLTTSSVTSTDTLNCFKTQVITSTMAKKMSDAKIEELFGCGVTYMRDLNQYFENAKQVDVPLTAEMKAAIKAGTPGDYRVPISCISSVDGTELKYTVGVIVMDDENTQFKATDYSWQALSVQAKEDYADTNAADDGNDSTNVNNTITVNPGELAAANNDEDVPDDLSSVRESTVYEWKMLRLLTSAFNINSYGVRNRYGTDKQIHTVSTYINNGIGTDEEKQEGVTKFLTDVEKVEDMSAEGIELSESIFNQGYFPLSIISVKKKDAEGNYKPINSNVITSMDTLLKATEGSYSVSIKVTGDMLAIGTVEQDDYYSSMRGSENLTPIQKTILGSSTYEEDNPKKPLYGPMVVKDPSLLSIPSYQNTYGTDMDLYINVADKPELSFKATEDDGKTAKYVIQYADFKGGFNNEASKRTLGISLKVNGKEVTDEATLSKITFTKKNIDIFNGKTWNVADVSTDGKLTLSGRQSGVMELSMNYNGTESTNKAIVIIPGDLDATGTISLNDAVQETVILRGAAETSISAAYGKELTNMNNLPGVDVDDIVKIVAMIRGISDYYNGPTSSSN